MSKILFSILLLSLSTVTQAEVVFKCYKSMSVMDPAFEQGTELYVDISIEAQRVDLDFGRAYGPSYIPTQEIQPARFGFSDDTSYFSARWENGSYISMVYLGGQWGLVTSLSEEFRAELDLPKEEEFYCRENVDVLEFTSRSN